MARIDDYKILAGAAPAQPVQAQPAQAPAQPTALDNSKKEKPKKALLGLGKGLSGVSGVAESFNKRPKVFLEAGEHTPYEFE